MHHENKQPAGDLSKILGSAISGVAGMMGDVKTQINERIESYLAKMDLVKREEFELIKAMISESRLEQDKLTKKIAALEKKLK